VHILEILLYVDKAQKHLRFGPPVIIQLLDINEPLLEVETSMAVFKVFYSLMLVKSLVDDPTSIIDSGKSFLEQKATEMVSDGSVLNALLS